MTRLIYKINVLFIFAVISLLASCSKDLGNYDYKEIKNVDITIAPAISALANMELAIPVKIDGMLLDENLYEYQWKAIKLKGVAQGEDPVTILAVTKQFNQKLTLGAGVYQLVYTITEKDRKIFFQATSDLNVTTTTSEGWLVLCSEDGKVRLDMVSTVTEGLPHFKNILEGSDMPYLNGPRSIMAINPKVTRSDAPFYLFTDEGATGLHKDAFGWKSEYDFKFELGNINDVCVPNTVVYAAGIRMLIGESTMKCSEYSGGLTSYWAQDLNYITNPDNSKKYLKMAPYLGTNVLGGAMEMSLAPAFLGYDMDGKQLVLCYGGSMGSMLGLPVNCTVATDGDFEGGAFTLPKGYDFVYMENINFNPFENVAEGVTYTMMKNGDNFHLYGMVMGDPLMALMEIPCPNRKIFYANLTGCTDIANAKQFAFSSIHNQLFYATSNKVYRVVLNGANPTAEEVLALSNETITKMRFYLYFNPDKKAVDLIVASQKTGAAEAESGVLRIYDTTSPTAKLGTPKEEYSGFAKIVDAIYKE